VTRLPLDAQHEIEPLRGPDFPTYKVAPVCAVHGCSRLTAHAHHIVRRSFTAGPYAWVKLGGHDWEDHQFADTATCRRCGLTVTNVERASTLYGGALPDCSSSFIVGNLMPLCWKHHQQITENRARIVWDEQQHRFFWQQGDQILDVAQPPSLETARSTKPELDSEKRDECPTCHRRMPVVYDRAREGKRPRKTWTITVPADSREVGADVLDVLLEGARLILDDRGLSYGEDRGVRYFVLSTALGIFVAHAEDILGDG
jgi:hypothetical protein